MWDFGPRPARPAPVRTPVVAPREADHPEAASAMPSAIPMDFSRVPARSSTARAREGAAWPEHADAVGNAAPAGLVRSPGAPLPPEVRRRLEARLGEDLGGVRVHTGPEAARAARELGAVGYTSGEDIVLGDRADAADDEHLLAHEAAHVVQQRHAGRLVPGVSAPGDAAERAADAVAAGTARATTSSGGAVAAIQRQTPGTRERAGVPRAEVEAALTEYLQRMQQEQGGQTLHNTDQVKLAVLQLFVGDPMRMAAIQAWLAGAALPGTPAGFAHEVARRLPGTIPGERLSKLRATPAKTDPDTRPKTAEEAAGALIVDTTVAPIVRGLKLSKETQKKIVDGAKSALAAGLVQLVDTVLDQAAVTGPAKNSIHNAVEGLIKYQPGKPMERRQDGAGSPYAPVVPPPVAPKAPSAPGEKIFKTPAIPFDFPSAKPIPKPSATPAAPSPAVLSAAGQVDRLSLTPAEARGTAREGDYAQADEFARDVAARLDEAQKKQTADLYLDLGGSYALVKDRASIFEAVKAIVFRMRDALPHHASAVVRIYLRVDGRSVYGFPLHSDN
jgi:hypothetical protein